MSVKSSPRLLPDILAEVFRFLPRENSTFDLTSSVWVVGQVCSSWRDVSLSTSAIWSSVYVNMKELLGKSESTSTAILSTVLQRSHAHLLYIQFTYDQEFQGAQALYDLLLNESGRWASFKCSVVWRSYSRLTRFKISPKSNSPSFNALREVDACNLSEIPGWIDLLKALGKSPSLKRLTLVNVRYAVEAFSALPWAQLSAFSYSIDERLSSRIPRQLDYPDDFTDGVLSSAPHLELFQTSQYKWKKNRAMGMTGPDFPLGSQWIVELELTNWTPGPEHLDDMDISSICLPSLRYLTLHRVSRNNLNQIIKMIERSSCSLLSITLSTLCFREATVKRLLSLSRTSLRKVKIGDTYIIGPSLLECFFSSSSSSDSDFFMPHLEELEITHLLMVDLQPYDRILALQFPSDLSRFHDQLHVHVDIENDDVALVTEPVPNLTLRVLAMINSAVAEWRVDERIKRWDATETILENMQTMHSIVTYLETVYGSTNSSISIDLGTGPTTKSLTMRTERSKPSCGYCRAVALGAVPRSTGSQSSITEIEVLQEVLPQDLRIFTIFWGNLLRGRDEFDLLNRCQQLLQMASRRVEILQASAGSQDTAE